MLSNLKSQDSTKSMTHSAQESPILNAGLPITPVPKVSNFYKSDDVTSH